MRLSLVIALLTLAISPAVASAQRCEAPPGTSAVEQYCEAIPSATGQDSAQDAQQAPQRATGAPDVSAQTAAALRRSGADGEGVLALAQTTGASAPARSTTARKNAAGAAETPQSTPTGPALGPDATADEPDAGPLAAITAAVADGVAISSAFGWVIVMLTLSLISVAWVRFRA